MPLPWAIARTAAHVLYDQHPYGLHDPDGHGTSDVRTLPPEGQGLAGGLVAGERFDVAGVITDPDAVLVEVLERDRVTDLVPGRVGHGVLRVQLPAGVRVVDELDGRDPYVLAGVCVGNGTGRLLGVGILAGARGRGCGHWRRLAYRAASAQREYDATRR